MPDDPASDQTSSPPGSRREQILSAAARLIAEKGFHPTKTKEIAEAAGVSEGTLYNYFESKSDILFGILGRLVEAQANASSQTDMIPRLSRSPREFFTNYLHYRKEHLDQNYIMMQAIISEILSDAELRQRYYEQIMEPSLKMMEGHLRLRQELGQMRPMNIPLVSRIINSLLLGLFLQKAMGDPLIDSDWDEIARLITSIFFDGLGRSP